jgi:hypothetical protein
VCTDESQYRDEWAGLTGHSPSEVYVPAAIRDPAEHRASVCECPARAAGYAHTEMHTAGCPANEVIGS